MKLDMTHLAALARLRFTPEEMEQYQQEMQLLVDMVSTLPKIEGDASLLDPQNPMVLRADRVTPSLPQADVLKNAAAQQAGCIVVPRTIE
jgi:aspartyl-tRNA(Asn)/glutamyl-tRNA(Gln) amidotransferase subunit C